jgi:serine protease Do
MRLGCLWCAVLALALSLIVWLTPAPAQTVDDIASSVVRVKTYINPDGRTQDNLGREREGSGVVIDDSGLVLTIGYLMVEAHAAQLTTKAGRTVAADVVGYDHDTGFGLLRASQPLNVKALGLGKSAEVKDDERVIAVSFGADMALPVRVVSRRAFSGEWEYLLDTALFTSPPHPAWSGAALVNRNGKLIGVGSLVVGDAPGQGDPAPGNMFVPIDLLPPILADLIADGRTSGPARPWMGLSTREVGGRLIVVRVTPGGPAEKAGVMRGDIVNQVGGERPRNLADFYRRVWALGRAGVNVPLTVETGGNDRAVDVKSIDRLDHLRLKSTL